MSSLRILFLDSWKSDPVVGSGTRVGISLLARALSELGHEVEHLRPAGRNGAGPDLDSTLPERLLFNLRLPRILQRRTPPPDLVVGFDIDGFRWSGMRRSVPYLLMLKGIAADEGRFSASRRERAMLAGLARLERRNASGADLVFVPSHYSAEVARREYELAPERIRVVPEGLHLMDWEGDWIAHREGAQRGDAPPRPTILSVARQYPRKDTATLLRALPEVRRAVPEVLLRVVGNGPELPRLRALAEELELGGNVRFEGALAEAEALRHAYAEALLFALPSRQEGFGIVFLEAMAAGLPVVAAAAGAAPEVIVEGETGLLIPPGDPGALATVLIRLLRDGELRGRMGRAGMERARHFGHQAMAERVLTEVKPLLGGAG